ncbi:hypothetical protein GGR77_004105 [Xanthomonas translucens]
MSLRTVFLFACLSLGAAPLAQAQPHCLPQGPIKVTLSGKLERPTSAPAAPESERQILVLPRPVCVAASPAAPAPRHDAVRRLRLELSQDQAAHLQEEGVGQIVRVTGTLSAAEGDVPPLLTVVGIDSD